MLEKEVLPRARRDTSTQFRETVMEEPAVLAAIDEYREKLRGWYERTTGDDSKPGALAGPGGDKLGFEQWLRVCDTQDLVGNWSVHQESDVAGDPACRTEHKFRLSMLQCKMAFTESQPVEEMGAAQAGAGDKMATLDFDEFLECLCRCGVDKYRAVKAMAPAAATRGFFRNLLGEANEAETVAGATYIKASRYDALGEAERLPGESGEELQRWLDCWAHVELNDMHGFPLWEEQVHGLLHSLFKDLSSIFLAYCRSLSEVSAEDAMEMSMEEFHDFVVDVGLETKKYRFDVMCNQFIKANATNTAAVASQRKRGNAPAAKKSPAKRAAPAAPGDAKRDQELVLYEFIALLVRIAFWRSNPNFGLHGNKDELVPVPAALHTVLTEIILPRAKRDTAAQFRDKYMGTADVQAVLASYSDRLRAWYAAKVADDSEEKVACDKITFPEWLRILDRQGLVGVWEVEQRSEITGDESCQGTVRCRLSVPQAKAAFMDSQNRSELGGGQQGETDAAAVLDFDEFVECLARCGVDKYRAIRAMKPAAAVQGFIKNLLDEATEEEVMTASTYIKAERFSGEQSKPLAGQSAEVHKHWLALWSQLELSGLHGFPLWEKEVHDVLQKECGDIASVFHAYCKSLKDTSAAAALEMDLDEFQDFAVDVGLETKAYSFEAMCLQFTKADNANARGAAAGPGNKALVLYEFLNVLVRIGFWRANPTYGQHGLDEATSSSQFVPVPMALSDLLREALPRARRDGDAAAFKTKVYALKEVQQAAGGGPMREWFARVASGGKLGIERFVSELKAINSFGTFISTQQSDVTADERAGAELKCRLSVPQAKAAFAAVGQGPETDFDGFAEAVARCGVDKYRGIKALAAKPEASVSGFVQNLLGEASEEDVVSAATYIKAHRFDASKAAPLGGQSAEAFAEWRALWGQLQLSAMPGFPLWEKEVHDALQAESAALLSIFAAYAAGSVGGGAREMDMDEFKDFAIDCKLPTKEYGLDMLGNEFTRADGAGAGDKVLEAHEFLQMLVHVAYQRTPKPPPAPKAAVRQRRHPTSAHLLFHNSHNRAVPSPTAPLPLAARAEERGAGTNTRARARPPCRARRSRQLRARAGAEAADGGGGAQGDAARAGAAQCAARRRRRLPQDHDGEGRREERPRRARGGAQRVAHNDEGGAARHAARTSASLRFSPLLSSSLFSSVSPRVTAAFRVMAGRRCSSSSGSMPRSASSWWASMRSPTTSSRASRCRWRRPPSCRARRTLREGSTRPSSPSASRAAASASTAACRPCRR